MKIKPVKIFDWGHIDAMTADSKQSFSMCTGDKPCYLYGINYTASDLKLKVQMKWDGRLLFTDFTEQQRSSIGPTTMYKRLEILIPKHQNLRLEITNRSNYTQDVYYTLLRK